MAILFMLAVDCGTSHEVANRIVEHFRQIARPLSDGTLMTFYQDPGEIWDRKGIVWCSVIPHGVSASGVSQRITKASLRVEVAKGMYDELRKLGGFRFAVLGWEAASECEWLDILKAKGRLDSLPRGLIVGSELWRMLDEPKVMVPFGHDTWWIPIANDDYEELVRSFGDGTGDDSN